MGSTERKNIIRVCMFGFFFPPSLGGGGGAAPLSHVATSAPANVVFSRSELGQPGPFLSWLWYSESERLDIP